MKKLLLTLVACMAVSATGFSQGQVNFNNRVANPSAPGTFLVDAPVSNVGGLTRLEGPSYMVQLYAGPSGTAEAALTPVGDALPFRAGAGAGYINVTGVDPNRVIPGVAAGAQATIQLRAWDVASGASWDVALIRGESNIFAVTTGGGLDLPANLVGLQSFNLAIVPEPSTIALGLVGFAALMFRFRRK